MPWKFSMTVFTVLLSAFSAANGQNVTLPKSESSIDGVGRSVSQTLTDSITPGAQSSKQQLAAKNAAPFIESEPIVAELSPTTFDKSDNEVIQASFKSPTTFLMPPKAPKTVEVDSTLDLNHPRTVDLSSDRSTANAQSTKSFIGLEAIQVVKEMNSANRAFLGIESFIANNNVSQRFSLADVNVQPDVFIQGDIYVDNRVRMSHQPHQSQDDKLSETAKRIQENNQKWTQELAAPLGTDVFTRATASQEIPEYAFSADGTQKKSYDFTDHLDYNLTSQFAPHVRSNDQVVWFYRSKLWEAPNFYHRPLYLADENLERYGLAGRYQALRSTLHFFGQIPIIRYDLTVGSRLPGCRVYTLGHGRPGSRQDACDCTGFDETSMVTGHPIDIQK
jgi:hypothetical protein